MRLFSCLIAVPCWLALSSCGGATTNNSGGGSAGGAAGSSGVGGGGGSGVVACGKLVCVGGDVCCNSSCGICTKPNGACPAIACIDDRPPPADCNMLETAPVLRSCMQPFGTVTPPPTFGEPVDLSAHGKVMSVINGALEGGCMESTLKLEGAGPELAAQTQSLLVSDGTRTWDVEYLIPGVTLPNFTSSVVDVAYHYQFGGFGPTQRHLSVISDRGSSIYQGDGGDLADLQGLPVALRRGAAVCSTKDTCGDWQRYDLNAGEGDLATVIAHGSFGAVGNFLVVHGGYAEQTSANSMCADWFVADVHVAVVK